ncbi:MAG: peptidoglycan-binding domain-containing protein [Candidatus Omnitrophica bacterium]|nr:peptidoglycan-binding domain-containing protein [Candidatus Omnitrophota bacterium]
MFKKVLFFLILVVFVASLSGCATFGKKKDLDAQGLKNQVSLLEAQIQSKDQEISALKEELSKATEKTESVAKESAVESRHIGNVKQIQTALKNAGFDPGNIDGRMGKQTRDAIKAFQKAHNLKTNGKVNKSTWKALSQYLQEKTK